MQRLKSLTTSNKMETTVGSSTPMYPPSPVVEHLTTPEIQALNDVFLRLERFDLEEAERISKLQRDVVRFEETVQRQTSTSERPVLDLRLCRLCFKNKFTDGIGHVCVTCRRRVCSSCGSMEVWRVEGEAKVTGIADTSPAASGIWYHGHLAQPVISTRTLRQKLGSDGGSSTDHAGGAAVEADNGTKSFVELSANKSDSELHTLEQWSPRNGHNFVHRPGRGEKEGGSTEREEPVSCGGGGARGVSKFRPAYRRRLQSLSAAEDTGALTTGDDFRYEDDYDDDDDVDLENDAAFLEERQKCRQLRLQAQQKKTRKRPPRRAAVGTCTVEDNMMLSYDQASNRMSSHAHTGPRPKTTDHFPCTNNCHAHSPAANHDLALRCPCSNMSPVFEHARRHQSHRQSAACESNESPSRRTSCQPHQTYCSFNIDSQSHCLPHVTSPSRKKAASYRTQHRDPIPLVCSNDASDFSNIIGSFAGDDYLACFDDVVEESDQRGTRTGMRRTSIEPVCNSVCTGGHIGGTVSHRSSRSIAAGLRQIKSSANLRPNPIGGAAFKDENPTGASTLPRRSSVSGPGGRSGSGGDGCGSFQAGALLGSENGTKKRQDCSPENESSSTKMAAVVTDGTEKGAHQDEEEGGERGRGGDGGRGVVGGVIGGTNDCTRGGRAAQPLIQISAVKISNKETFLNDEERCDDYNNKRDSSYSRQLLMPRKTGSSPRRSTKEDLLLPKIDKDLEQLHPHCGGAGPAGKMAATCTGEAGSGIESSSSAVPIHRASTTCISPYKEQPERRKSSIACAAYLGGGGGRAGVTGGGGGGGGGGDIVSVDWCRRKSSNSSVQSFGSFASSYRDYRRKFSNSSCGSPGDSRRPSDDRMLEVEADEQEDGHYEDDEDDDEEDEHRRNYCGHSHTSVCYTSPQRRRRFSDLPRPRGPEYEYNRGRCASPIDYRHPEASFSPRRRTIDAGRERSTGSAERRFSRKSSDPGMEQRWLPEWSSDPRRQGRLSRSSELRRTVTVDQQHQGRQQQQQLEWNKSEQEAHRRRASSAVAHQDANNKTSSAGYSAARSLSTRQRFQQHQQHGQQEQRQQHHPGTERQHEQYIWRGRVHAQSMDSRKVLSKSDVLPTFPKADKPRKMSESGVLSLIREKSSSKDDSECSSSLHGGRGGGGGGGGGERGGLGVGCGADGVLLTSHPQCRRSSSGRDIHVVLSRDPTDKKRRTAGLGMMVVGGKEGPDKKLGAYVTRVIKGGPADLAGIVLGDQILEWDGRSFHDATFEETREIIAQSGDTVQLVLVRNRGTFEGTSTKGSRGVKNSKRSSTHQSITAKEKELAVKDMQQKLIMVFNEKEKQTDANKSCASARHGSDGSGRSVKGSLNLLLQYDPVTRRLTVTIQKCEGLDFTVEGGKRRPPRPYVMITVLPKNSVRENHRTKIAKNPLNPEWNYTCVYEDVSPEKLACLSLLFTVWDDHDIEQDHFIGEVLLDLNSINLTTPKTDHGASGGGGEGMEGGETGGEGGRTALDNALEKECGKMNDKIITPTAVPLCFALEDHDMNAGPLPQPPNKYLLVQGTVKTTNLGCGGALGGVLGGEIGLGKRLGHLENCSLRDVKSVENYGSSKSLPATPSHSHVRDFLHQHNNKHSTGEADRICKRSPKQARRGPLRLFGDLKRRMTDVMIGLPEHLSTGENLNARQRKDSCARKSSITSSGTSSACSQITGTGLRNFSISGDDRLERYRLTSKESVEMATMLGPGQVLPKNHADKCTAGDIKLGFMISKGQLQVDVICAKELPEIISTLEKPDTYVKTSLVGDGKRMQKKHTKTVRSSTDPVYSSKLKYSACNVYGRLLQVLVKLRLSAFERSHCCLGEVLIKLDSLDLTVYTTGWYKLFKESSVDFWSSESVNL